MIRIAKGARWFFLIVGVVLFAMLIRKIGIGTVAKNIAGIAWVFVPVFFVSFLWYALYTEAWRQFLHRLSDGIRFFDLFRIKLMGEAVNTLTPANFIGGDPMRIYLLRKNFPVSEGAASVVVDRTLTSAATLVIIIIGITAALFTFESLPMNIKFGVPIVVTASSIFIIFILIHQRRGFFSLILNFCLRLGIKREFSEKTVNRFTELDTHIIDFYRENHKGFLIAFACQIAGRFLGVVEVYVIGRAVSDGFSLYAALMLAALAPMVNTVFAFIPGAFGVMESAYGGSLYLMHMDPAIGVTIQIVKRIRSVFWIALGLFFLGAHDRRKAWEEELIEEV